MGFAIHGAKYFIFYASRLALQIVIYPLTLFRSLPRRFLKMKTVVTGLELVIYAALQESRALHLAQQNRRCLVLKSLLMRAQELDKQAAVQDDEYNTNHNVHPISSSISRNAKGQHVYA